MGLKQLADFMRTDALQFNQIKYHHHIAPSKSPLFELPISIARATGQP